MASAGVPEDRRAARTKLEIAVAEIDRVREGGVHFGCVLADAGYGCSAPFRQALSARGLRWAVGISGRNKVYPADVAMIFPVARRGRPRERHVPDQVSVAAETILADMSGRSVTWRRGTKGRLCARFCALRVRMADGLIQWSCNLPSDEQSGYRKLFGFTNVQGRFANGGTDVCSTSVETATGRFVHLEQDWSVLRPFSDDWRNIGRYPVAKSLIEGFIAVTPTVR